MMGFGWMHGYGMWIPWGAVIGMVLNLAVIIGIVWLVIWAIRRFTSASRPGAGESPRDILQTRYARGEITRDQYQQMLQDLG